MKNLKALRKLKKEKGFTLLELLVVIAIIGVLAAVGFPVYTDYMDNSKGKAAIKIANIYKEAMVYCLSDGFTDCEAGKHDVPAAINPAKYTHIKSFSAASGNIQIEMSNGIIYHTVLSNGENKLFEWGKGDNDTCLADCNWVVAAAGT